MDIGPMTESVDKGSACVGAMGVRICGSGSCLSRDPGPDQRVGQEDVWTVRGSCRCPVTGNVGTGDTAVSQVRSTCDMLIFGGVCASIGSSIQPVWFGCGGMAGGRVLLIHWRPELKNIRSSCFCFVSPLQNATAVVHGIST